jgi:hypothetical protein
MEVYNMDIYFSGLDRKNIYRLPIIPADMPELAKSAKNEEFEGNTQTYNILGNVGLVTFSLDCWMPEYAGKYTQSWCKSQINPYLIINLWSDAMVNKVPIRCVMTRGQNKNNISDVILNWQVSVESLHWNPRQNKDIVYKADFKEYISPVDLDLSMVKTSLNNVINTLSKVSI